MATDPSGLISQLLSSGGVNGFQQGQQAYQQNQQEKVANAQALTIGQLKIQAAQAQAQQQHDYENDVQGYFRDPSPRNLASLVAKYPDQAAALKSSYDIMDAPAKESRLTQFGMLYSAANNGRADLAGQQLDNILSAEQAQGIVDKDAADLRDAVKAGDPDALTRLKAFSQIHLAAASPEFAKSLGIGKDKAENHVLSPGSELVDDTGKSLHRNDDAAPKYQTVKNADGSESIVQLGGGDPSSGTGAAPGGSGAPLSVRLNNPGAIRDNPANKWQGQIGSQGGFVQFDTSANGQRAHQRLIANQIKSGYDTPLIWAQHYAPASDGNDPVAYAQTVAAATGKGIHDKLTTADVAKIANASARVEAGGTPAPANYSAITPGQAAKVIFTSKGSDDADAGGLTPDALDFASNWAIAHGGKVPPGFSRNKAAQTALQNAIAEKAKSAGLSVQDVIAKGQDFVTQQGVLSAFSKGKQGDAVRSGSVALDHLAQLHDAVLALKNGNIPAFNAISQSYEKATGNAIPTNAAAIKGIVSDEVNKAVLAGNGALADRKDVKDTLDLSGSNDQILGAIRGYTGLLGGQLSGLARQYKAGTGRNDFAKFLSPTAQRLLARSDRSEGAQASPVSSVPSDVAAILKKYGH